MRPNLVKRKIAAGQTAFGTMMFEFASTGIARLAAGAGAEFAVFDMEHTGWTLETIRSLMATARATELVPLVRIPAVEYHFAARALDVGAMGIMAPMVESAAQAEKLVASMKYPPVGRRGAAFSVAHDDYAGGDVVAKIQSANDETLVIAQIETAAGLDAVDAIAGVPGIDVLWIGHFDLTNSLGIAAQFDHPKYHDAVARVLAACKQHGKTPAMLAADVATAKQLLAQGFRMLAYGGDLWLYQAALRAGIAELRSNDG